MTLFLGHHRLLPTKKGLDNDNLKIEHRFFEGNFTSFDCHFKCKYKVENPMEMRVLEVGKSNLVE